MPARKDHVCARCGAPIDVRGHMGRVLVQEQAPREFYLLNGRKGSDVSHRNVAPATKLCAGCLAGAQSAVEAYVAEGAI